MKKQHKTVLILFVFSLCLYFVIPVSKVAEAQESPATITQLHQHILTLRAIVESLKTQLETLARQGGYQLASTGTLTQPSLLTQDLGRGSSGREVLILQNFLLERQLFDRSSVTGFYGVLTEQAVRTYQCQKGIVCSGLARTTGYGLVGPTTRKHINDDILSSHNERTAQYKIDPGFHDLSVWQGNINRPYALYIPQNYSASQPYPVVVFLHGGAGSITQAKNYDWQSKADKEGFILAIPNGASRLSGGAFATWNAGGCCGYARDNQSDDVGYIRQVINDIRQRANVDTNRVYATGMSNGGMMAYRLACDATDVFAGIAAVAGTDGTTSCSPSERIPVLHIHAKNDDHVLYDGGAGPGSVNKELIMDFTSVPETIARWVKYNNIVAGPTRTFETTQGGGAYCETQRASLASVEVKLCVTETGGHSWPGANLIRRDTSNAAIVANDVIWEFFSAHSKSRQLSR